MTSDGTARTLRSLIAVAVSARPCGCPPEQWDGGRVRNHRKPLLGLVCQLERGRAETVGRDLDRICSGRLAGLQSWAGGVPPAIGSDGDGRAAAEGGAGAGARGGELDFNTLCRAAGSSDNSYSEPTREVGSDPRPLLVPRNHSDFGGASGLAGELQGVWAFGLGERAGSRQPAAGERGPDGTPDSAQVRDVKCAISDVCGDRAETPAG